MKTGIVTTLIALCLPVSVFATRCGFQPMSIFWYSTARGFPALCCAVRTALNWIMDRIS